MPLHRAASPPSLAGRSAMGLCIQGSSCCCVSFFPIRDQVCVALPSHRRSIVDTLEDDVVIAPY